MRNVQNIFYIFFLCFTAFSYGQVTSIMTYNIRFDNPKDGKNQWQQRKAFLTSQISFYEPDIFGIQEGLYHQVKYLDSMSVDYNYVGVGRDDGINKGEYTSIFFNAQKFNPIKQSTFWLSQTPDMPSVGWDAALNRICTYALFENKVTRKKFWVFNTHFDHVGKKARLESVKLILTKIKQINTQKIPIVLIGDFNLEPDTEGIQIILNTLQDAHDVVGKKAFGPVGTYNGFRFEEPVTRRIDYIFTSKNDVEVLKSGILSDSKDCRYPSDHFPVYVTLSFRYE